MNYEEKYYLKTYLKFYLFFVLALVVAGVIGVGFFNQEIVGLLWVFGVVSIGLFIGFIVKKQSLRKQEKKE